MDINAAISTIRTLARGINPVTGEKFAEDSPYNDPTIIRALFEILDRTPTPRKTPEEKQKENVAKGLPKNTGLLWDEESRKQVAEAFKAGQAIDEIARAQERTKSAIVSELVRQNVIDSEKARLLYNGRLHFENRAS